jgi:hypothetical protein
MKIELDSSASFLEDDEIEYVLVERRTNIRRKSSPNAPLPPGLRVDRRWSEDRREEDADSELSSSPPRRLD